jgi:hypothetical protein
VLLVNLDSNHFIVIFKMNIYMSMVVSSFPTVILRENLSMNVESVMPDLLLFIQMEKLIKPDVKNSNRMSIVMLFKK